MDYDRLRELQEKFEENPRRYFAPLANEYRKGGQHKRAIEICRTHLAQMPGHMSGQIVFGQALFESGEWDEARTVFGRALTLDPENLIALRSLGDMALQAGDTAEARSWYTRLLDADPKDTTVIALLAEIESSRGTVGARAADEIPSVAASGGEQASTFAEEVAEPAQPAQSSTTGFSDSPPAETVYRRDVESDSPAVDAASRPVEEPLGLERHYPAEAVTSAEDDEAALGVSGEPMEGITSWKPDTGNALTAPADEADALSWEPPPSATENEETSFRDQPEPVSANQAELAPDYADATNERTALSEESPGDTEEYVAAVSEESVDATDEYLPAASEESVGATAVHEDSVEERAAAAPERGFSGASAEPFVNETMAQLYLQQGYRQLALKIYRQLSAARPHDQSLRDRIADIEAADAAEHPDEVPVMRKEEPSIERPTEPGSPRSPSIESPTPWNQPGSEESPGVDRSPVDSPPTAPPSRDGESIEAPAPEEPRAEPEGIAARQPSVREFFATLGRRRPPGVSGTAAMRPTPTVPVDAVPVMDTIPPASLDAVFAGATVSPADARAASRLAGAFSGATGGGSRTPLTPAVPTPRVNPRMPQVQESEEDVAKFRAWLDGLTRE